MSRTRPAAAEALVGLIPAAGYGSRLGRLSGSKEVVPVGGSPPRVASSYALEQLRRARVPRAFVVLRAGKWDIPGYWLDGSAAGLELAYLVMKASPSVPATLDHAYAFVRGATVCLVYPDIVVEPVDALACVLERLARGRAEVVLGVVPTDRPDKADMVALARDGRLRAIEVKPARTRLRHTWAVAAWRPGFSEFLHRFVAAPPTPARSEVQVGDAFTAALAAGLRIEAEVFPRGSHLDLGTPEDLARFEARGQRRRRLTKSRRTG